MYAYIKGRLAEITPTTAVVETNGIGYALEISLKTFDKIREMKEVKLAVQLIVREDSHTLYGFETPLDKHLFNKLISVSGIGPNTARLIQSGMTGGEIFESVEMENDVAFKAVKGIGAKTAKRIILDLKGKMGTDLDIPTASVSGKSMPIGGNMVYDEALTALIGLGFRRNQITTVLSAMKKELGSDVPVEDVIRRALQAMAAG